MARTKLHPIESITPFTMLDYHGTPSGIVWFCGCNMRCSYCYNPEIVFSKGKHSVRHTLDFFNNRKSLLKGVVLSGGEPTLYRRINYFAKELKAMGYKIKLDTNGTKPKTLKRMLDNGVLDFVSLDFKAPKDKFQNITKMKEAGYEEVAKSLKILKNSNIEYEVRTTVHSDLLTNQDLSKMIENLKNYGLNTRYYLQNFLKSNTIDSLEEPLISYDMTAIVRSANENRIEIDFRNF